MTGTLQTFARKYQVAIDELTFKYEILSRATPSEIEQGPDDGVIVYGLFLEGARFDREVGLLKPSLPGVMFEVSVSCVSCESPGAPLTAAVEAREHWTKATTNELKE